MGPPFTSADSFVAKAEKDRNHLRFQTAGIIAKPPPRERPQPLVRTLVIRQVEINRLADIDIIRQRFNVEFVVHLAFEGGALDVELSKSSADFPLDGWGRPTFRPSASWYMAQVDFNNAHEYKTLDAKVLTEGDDLILTLRFEGCFSEVMELEHFPCDVQDLTMSLAFNCRTTGMMPLRLAASPDLKSSISKDGFVDGKMWTLHPELEVRPGETGTSADRMFPSLQMVLLVGRNPLFYFWNIALPVCLFVPMAALQFTVQRDYSAERLGVSLAIVLTAIAHKYSMTTLVPSVSYLTFLDKYVLMSLLLIVLITFQGGLIGAVEVFYCRTQAVYDPEDLVDAPPAAPPAAPLTAPAGRRGLLGASASSSSGGAATSRLPAYYLDEDCPYQKMGPFNKFDVIDGGCCAADVLLWLLLQVWAYFYYRRVREHLGHRIEDIAHGKVLAAAKHAALDREEKAAAAAAAAPSASVLAASGVAGALNGVLPSKPSTPGGASNARRDTRRKSMPAPLHRSATRTLERQGLSRSRTQALALPAAPGSNPHSVLKNFAHLSHGAGARGAVDLHDEIDDDLEAEGTAVGGSPPSHASAPLPEPRAAPARAAHSCDPLPAPPPARAPPTAPAPVPVPPIAAAPSVAAPPVRGARTSALLPKMPSSPARTAPAGYVKSDSG